MNVRFKNTTWAELSSDISDKDEIKRVAPFYSESK
jgi:hypothetical protein